MRPPPYLQVGAPTLSRRRAPCRWWLPTSVGRRLCRLLTGPAPLGASPSSRRSRSESQSSLRRSSPESSWIRRRRCRSVFGWTYSASAVALMLPRRRRNSSSVRSSESGAGGRTRRSSRSGRDGSRGRTSRGTSAGGICKGRARRRSSRPGSPGSTEPSSACPASSKPAWNVTAPLHGLEIPIETGLPASAWTVRTFSTSAPSPTEGTRRSARVESSRRSKSEPGPADRDRLLERVVGRRYLDDEVLPVEIAAEAGCSSLDGAEDVAACELFEEVLDQVLLREPLDQLDLLDRDGGLVRGCAGEVDLGGPVRADEPEELVVGDDGDGHACRAATSRDLGPELGEADGGTRRLAGGRRRAQAELLRPSVEEIDMARAAAQEAASALGHGGEDIAERAAPGPVSPRAQSGARVRRRAAWSPRRGGRSLSRRRRGKRSTSALPPRPA